MHYEIAEPACVYENISGEVLVLNLSTGIYTQMRSLSAEAFDTLASGATVDALVRGMLAAGYGESEVATVQERIVAWCTQGYLRPSRSDTKVNSVYIKSGGEFDEQSWDDLSELIKLDPVHDVTPQGWPQAAE